MQVISGTLNWKCLVYTATFLAYNKVLKVFFKCVIPPLVFQNPGAELCTDIYIIIKKIKNCFMPIQKITFDWQYFSYKSWKFELSKVKNNNFMTKWSGIYVCFWPSKFEL